MAYGNGYESGPQSQRPGNRQRDFNSKRVFIQDKSCIDNVFEIGIIIA
jgi:hypothetical protein